MFRMVATTSRVCNDFQGLHVMANLKNHLPNVCVKNSYLLKMTLYFHQAQPSEKQGKTPQVPKYLESRVLKV